MADGVIHAAGMDIQFGPYRRQRCAWCGAVLIDDDLTGMAWALNEDDTDPGPPPFWPLGALVEVVGGTGDPSVALSRTMMRVVPESEWPDSIEHPGEKAVPSNACLRLDPEVTR